MNEKIDVLAVMDLAAGLLIGCPDDDVAEDCSADVAKARAAVAELIEVARAAEFHLSREHRAPMTVDAADYLTELERDRNRIRAALARVGGA